MNNKARFLAMFVNGKCHSMQVFCLKDAFFYYFISFLFLLFFRNGKIDDVVLGYDKLEGEMELFN